MAVLEEDKAGGLGWPSADAPSGKNVSWYAVGKDDHNEHVHADKAGMGYVNKPEDSTNIGNMHAFFKKSSNEITAFTHKSTPRKKKKNKFQAPNDLYQSVTSVHLMVK